MKVQSGDVINIDAGVYTESVINVTNSITLNGTNSYTFANPPFLKHISRTVIKPMFTNDPDKSMVIFIKTNGVTIQNLTIEGDVDSNGTADVMYAIYSTNRPMNVNHCLIRNINGYGIVSRGIIPPPATNDTDIMKNYFGYNQLTDITSSDTAVGIYMDLAPATCEFNEIAHVTGVTASTAMYIHECHYTICMTNPITIRNNYFDRCANSIWANKFGTTGETIVIAGNIITNGLIGIHVSTAMGKALVTSNTISVSDIWPTNQRPACGIWIHADQDPWSVSSKTDHLVEKNVISGFSTNADDTIGMLLAYNESIQNNQNNGVRATLLNNSVHDFDYGIVIRSGTNGVAIQHDPFVEVSLRTNDIFSNFSYGLYIEGMTNIADAVSNWWGSYFGATGIYGSITSSNIPLGAYWTDTNGNGTNDWLDTDDDGDKLLDTNEMALGTSPAKTDSDGDGSTDPSELVAGTEPTNALSVLKFYSIDTNPTNGNWFELKWPSATGRKYSIYRTIDLITGFTSPLATAIQATASMNTYTDKAAVGSGPFFYRITVTN
jgi:hypothetical protein